MRRIDHKSSPIRAKVEIKGNRYYVNDVCVGNRGDAIEILVKMAWGVEAVKEPSTRFDIAPDMTDANGVRYSIKSRRFTLTSAKIGETKEVVRDAYLQTVAADYTIYATITGKTLEQWIIPMDVFGQFIDRHCTFEQGAKVVRGPHTEDNKLFAWFRFH